ncbi:hypothetical protein [Bradyrhizobium ottawaense]|uniref:hypothetical protein n=1 Tax=Bradyrhizobium ottawaense TaxID=931866 RepID=UPI003393B92E
MRLALLATVASCASWLAQPGSALAGPASCTTVGGAATCSGDQSAGIGAADFDQAAVGTLNVNALTTDIAPASGVAAISYHRGGGSITINRDLSLRTIRATGITDAVSASTDGDVTINHAGNISSAGGAGIYVTTTGGFFGTTDIRITSSGTIDAYSDGIHARYQGPGGSNGNIVVAHTGDITSQDDLRGVRRNTRCHGKCHDTRKHQRRCQRNSGRRRLRSHRQQHGKHHRCRWDRCIFRLRRHRCLATRRHGRDTRRNLHRQLECLRDGRE